MGVTAHRIAAFEHGRAPISGAMLQRLFHVVHDRFVHIEDRTPERIVPASATAPTERSRTLKNLSDEQGEDLLKSLEGKSARRLI